MKTFVDATIDSHNNPQLYTELLQKLDENNPANLSTWFKNKGYEVNSAESQKLVDNRNVIRNSGVGAY